MKTVEFKNLTIEQKSEFLNPLIDLAFKMLQSGVLKKNVVRHFTNRGLPTDASINIVDIACARVDNFTNYKIKNGCNVPSKLDIMPKYLRTGYTSI